MQLQPTCRKPLRNSLFQAVSLCFISAMANHIVRVTLERDGRKLPAHPKIEGIVEIEIRQQRADHSLNAKGNFCFDRVIRNWQRSVPVLDLRRKR